MIDTKGIPSNRDMGFLVMLTVLALFLEALLLS
jgi:hypothetical protein